MKEDTNESISLGGHECEHLCLWAFQAQGRLIDEVTCEQNRKEMFVTHNARLAAAACFKLACWRCEQTFEVATLQSRGHERRGNS